VTVFRVYIKHPDGTMSERISTGDLAEAERHFAMLCSKRTDGPAAAVFQSPTAAIPTRHYRLDKGFPDEARSTSQERVRA
jgi:hypothetical protein